MTPEALSALHVRCFVTPRPWTTEGFRNLLSSPGVFLVARGSGFALGRLIADEAELLTLAVDPADRRRGKGRDLLREFVKHTQGNGATMAFLEVSASNHAAISLYRAEGFEQSGRRPGYYRSPNNERTDALLFRKCLA